MSLDDLAGRLEHSRLITDPDVMEAYRRDQADTVRAGRPVAVLLAETTGDVAAALAWAGQHQTAVVPRGAGTGLAGGATALDGCLVLSTERMTAIRELAPDDRLAVVEAGVLNADIGRAAARVRADVRAGPEQLRDLHHRREHRHQRGRAALRQVRGDPRLGARARGGAGRRPGRAHRGPDREGGGRVRPDQPVHRVGGDAGGDHRGHGRAARPGRRPSRSRWWAASARCGPRATRWRRWSGPG